jgi:MFS family permease
VKRPSAIRRLARNRRLSAVLAAAALSSFGDWLYLAALPMVVYQATGDAALLGLAAAGRLLPFFLLSVPAGAIADRFDRRRVVIVAETARAAIMLLMAAIALLGGSAVALIVLATMSAAAGTFAMPAHLALIPELARDDDELGLANATSMTLDNGASVLAPLAAAVLVMAAGLAPACAVNGLTFLVVVGALVTIGPSRERPARGHESDRPAEAVQPARPVRTLVSDALPVFALDAAVSFAAGALGVLPVLLAVHTLGGGEELAGLVNAAGGAGAVIGGVAAGLLVGRDQRAWVRLGIAAAAAGVAAIALPSLAIVLVASTAATAALVMLDTLNITTLQRTLPGATHGRVFGLLHTSAAAWLIGGSAIPPLVAGAFGVEAATILTAGVVAGLGGCCVIIDRARADRSPASDGPPLGDLESNPLAFGGASTA